MSRKTSLPRLYILIYIGLAILFSGNMSIDRANAQELDQTYIYLPLVTRPVNISSYLSEMDLSRFSGITTQLVQGYGPRHHARYHVFIDRNCTIGVQVYSQSNLIRSLVYVKDYLTALGYPITKEYVADGTGSFNVVATKLGSVYPNIFIEIGAHIDTKNATPGASDNAAAVASVLELATVLKDHPSRYSLRFISFVGEETHTVNSTTYHLTGSRHHAVQVVARNEIVKIALVMDGIGWSETYPHQMNCIWDNGSAEGSRVANIFNNVRSTFNLDIDWRRCTPYPLNQVSDNVSYWEQGLPAVLSIGGLPYLDPNYHACTDDMLAANLQNAFTTAQQNLVVALTLDGEIWDFSLQPDNGFKSGVLWLGEGH